MIDETLKNAFGLNCRYEEIKLEGLPYYMVSRRKLYKVSIGDKNFLLVELGNNEKFGTSALSKQLLNYSTKAGMEVAFSFSDFSKVQRDALLSKGIPFISGSDQIYLPFLGMLLTNNFKKKLQINIEHMMPATQCLFLYLLYKGQGMSINKKQASEALELTAMSVTRASQQLKQMNLLTEEQHGKEMLISLVNTGFKMYELAKDYLINPVQKLIYIKGSDLNSSCVIAGESALSRNSMLGEPNIPTYAIYKGDSILIDVEEVDPQWEEESNICRIELWKYNPQLFAMDNQVDPVSLALSLVDINDERVQGELETFLDEYNW